MYSLHSSKRWRPNALSVVLMLATALPAVAQSTNGFDARIRPLLERNCLPCHGPDDRMSGLTVTSVDGLLSGGARRGAGRPRGLRGRGAPCARRQLKTKSSLAASSKTGCSGGPRCQIERNVAPACPARQGSVITRLLVPSKK